MKSPVRTRQLRTLFGVAAVSLAVAAPSSAAPFTSSLERAYGTALRYWGGPPPNCLSIDRQVVAGLPNGYGAEATIATEPTACILYIDRHLAGPRDYSVACAVLVHEVGHLWGREHSEDSRNIMYPQPKRVPRICRAPRKRQLRSR